VHQVGDQTKVTVSYVMNYFKFLPYSFFPQKISSRFRILPYYWTPLVFLYFI